MGFPPIKKNEPPWYVLEAWRNYEIETGEILTREELAITAALVVTHYLVDIFSKHPEAVKTAKAMIDRN